MTALPSGSGNRSPSATCPGSRRCAATSPSSSRGDPRRDRPRHDPGAAGDLLGRSRLFDVFRGGSIPEGRKSLAFALEFRALDRTLTDQEIEPLIAAIVGDWSATWTPRCEREPKGTSH